MTPLEYMRELLEGCGATIPCGCENNECGLSCYCDDFCDDCKAKIKTAVEMCEMWLEADYELYHSSNSGGLQLEQAIKEGKAVLG